MANAASLNEFTVVFGSVVQFTRVVLNEVAPSIEKPIKELELAYKKLNLNESEVKDVKRKFTSCKNNVIEALNSADCYVQNAKKCLQYSDLDKKAASEIKAGYKRFLCKKSDEEHNGVSAVNISSQNFQIIAMIVLLVAIYTFGLKHTVYICIASIVALIVLVWYCAHRQNIKERAFERVKAYLSRLSSYHGQSVQSYKKFTEKLVVARDDCNEALKVCEAVNKVIAENKATAMSQALQTTAKAGVVTFAATLPIGGLPGAIVLASFALGVCGTATFELKEKYKRISSCTEDVENGIEKVAKLARECGINMQQMSSSLDSLHRQREDVGDHIAIEEEYHSFCRNLDIMLDTISEAQKSLESSQAKQQIQSAINELKS